MSPPPASPRACGWRPAPHQTALRVPGLRSPGLQGVKAPPASPWTVSFLGWLRKAESKEMMLGYLLLVLKSFFCSPATALWGFPGFCKMGNFHTSKMPVALFTEVDITASVPQPNIAQVTTRNCAIA